MLTYLSFKDPEITNLVPVLHSYAGGDPVPVPSFVYISVFVLFTISIISFVKYKKINTES